MNTIEKEKKTTTKTEEFLAYLAREENEKEYKAYEIARSHLDTYFHLERSRVFLDYCKEKEKK